MAQKYQEVKRYLNKYRFLIWEAETVEREIARLRARVDMKSPALTGMPGGGRPYLLDDYAADVADLLEDLHNLERRAILVYKSISQQIDEVPDPLHRIILRRRYLLGESLQEIADGLIYSYGRIRHLHGEALRGFAEVKKDSTT